ncbi:MAG: hypothetical protein AB7V16_06985 [Vulcanibacillus sp.]
MPVALLKDTKLSIREIMLYTDRYFKTRFEYSERDILNSKIRVIQKKTYVKDRPNIFEEKLEIESWSAPQYYPYNKHTKGRRQMKYKHHYSIVIQLAKDDNGIYSYDSKIRWRVGSFKQVPRKVPQSKIKSIYHETRRKVKSKYENMKLTKNQISDLVRKDLDKIRKSGTYLNTSDYISQALGINLDNYNRNFYIQNQFGCLYGPLSNAKPSEDNTLMPFFCKHMIAVLMFLMKKKIIKVK